MVRLLIYLILVCCIPVAGSIWFYSHQSAAQTRLELSKQVTQLHEQTVYRLQLQFENIENRVLNISNDYAIQRLSEGSILKGSAEERILRDYSDQLIRQQTSQLPYIKDMCISFDFSTYNYCSKSGTGTSVLNIPQPTLRKNERWVVPMESKGAQVQGFQVSYGAPLLDPKTNVIKGFVLLMVELDGMMQDIYTKLPLVSNHLFDSNGAVLYRKVSSVDRSYGADLKDAEGYNLSGTDRGEPLQWKKDTIVSRQKLELPGIMWISQIEVPQDLEQVHVQTLYQTLLLGLLLFFFVSGLSAYLFRHYFTRPLQHLRGLMNRAELGDFKAYWMRKSSQEWNELGESYNQMLNRLEELIKQVKREEALKKEAEMEALQYQLNPHFLYNTLNTIKWVAKMHKTPQIADVVTSLVRLLQASLGKKGDFITVKEEIGLIHDYMEIQSFRYGDKIKLTCDMDPLAQGCLVPRMILQPLIENAIIHGIEPGRQEGIIHIRIWLEMERDMLFCQVEDNGVGMAEDETACSRFTKDLNADTMRDRMSGIGLRHIREKIKLYYGNGYSMHMVSKPKQGTTIRLSMPAHQSEVEYT